MADIPYRYIVFDTETNEHIITKEPRHVSLRFRLGVAKLVIHPLEQTNENIYYNLSTPDQIFDHIDAVPYSKDKLWIFAHNIGFDLRIVGLFNQISKGRYSLLNPCPPTNSKRIDTPFVVLDDPPTIIRTFRPDGQEVLWLDTWQWLSNSLAKIGSILGNSKGVMPPLSAPDSDWYPYCQQDVDVLDDAMRRVFSWIRTNKYKSFHPTRAGQAKLIYQQMYEKKRIKYHNDPQIQAIERPSYYGGYTECLRVGRIEGPVHQVDANSLYPFVMSKYWYPAEVVDWSDSDEESTDRVRHSPKRMIAEVYLNARKNAYPLRCKEGTVFVKGRVRTVLPGPELKAAFDAGEVVKTTRFVEYRMEPLFTDFVKDMYAFRMRSKAEGNEIFDYFYKLVMNSLYGKFGQLTAEWEYAGSCDSTTVFAQGWTVGEDGSDPVETRYLAGTKYTRQQQVDHPKSFVAIASFVTSYAREYMRYIRSLLPSDGSYYQATDSLYVSDESFNILRNLSLINPAKLGWFKHEATYKELTIHNIHNLDKDDKHVRGSIKSRAVEVAPNTYQQESWENLLPGIKSGHTAEVQIREVIKRMEHRYDRQIVHPDGSVTPHVVNNWGVTPSESANRWQFRHDRSRR